MCPTSLSLSLSFVHAIVIWTVRIVAASSHLLFVWFRLTLTVLASIICNHSACLSSVFVYMYISLCNIVIWILRCSSCIWTIFLSSSLISPHPTPTHPPTRLILKLSSLFFFFFSLSLFLLTWHYHLFHHYSGSHCCYYCFMCSLLACRLAGTDCKNRQLPKILILV